MDEAPVHIFVMGVNRWRDEPAWPLARARNTPFYLASEGRANTLTGDGGLQSKPERAECARVDSIDQFTYDPRNPVPTHGRRGVLRSEDFPLGPHGPAAGGKAQRCSGVH